MPGVLGTIWKGNKLLATVIVGFLVGSLLIATGPTVVGGIAVLAGLFVVGRLA